MQLQYFSHPCGNFGDDLNAWVWNAWVWDSLLPGWKDWSNEVTLTGVRTLLNKHGVALLRNVRNLVGRSGVWQLLRAQTYPSQLSDRLTLRDRKTRYREILREGACDYGKPAAVDGKVPRSLRAGEGSAE